MKKIKVFILVAVMLVSWNSAFAQQASLIKLNPSVKGKDYNGSWSYHLQTGDKVNGLCLLNHDGNFNYTLNPQKGKTQLGVTRSCNWITINDSNQPAFFDHFVQFDTPGTVELDVTYEPYQQFLPAIDR